MEEDGGRAPAGSVLGPLPLWAVAAVVGALAGEALAGVGLAVGGVAVAVFATTALAVVARTVGRRCDARCVTAEVGAGLLALVTVAVVTAAGTVVRVATTDLGLLPHRAAHGGTVDVELTVAAEPRPIRDGWHVLATVTAVDGQATRERAALTLPDAPALGARARATVTARPLPEGGYGRWLARQHAQVVLDAGRWEPAGAPGPLARSSEVVRDRIRTAASRHLPDDRAGLLVGFVTGDTRMLDPEDRQAMQDTSLSHLTAVSGSNVAILLAGVLGVAGLVRAGARTRRAAVLVTVCWFAYLTRFEPSVLRAGTMALLILATAMRGVPRDARHALSGAVLVLLLVDPRLAGSLGLLLSATAAAGVLVASPRIRARLRRLPGRLADLLAITLGAQVAVVPLLLATFGELRFVAIPANLVAVPVAAAGAVLAFVGSAVSVVSITAAGWWFAAAGPAAAVVLAVARGLRDVGGVASAADPVALVALACGCVWLLTRPRSPRARVAATLTAVALLAAAVPVGTARLPVTVLRVTAIDVGQGDAFLVESPGARLLVDTGEDDQAARWLRSRGRRHLDLLILTHAHRDHVGGAAAVVRQGRVGAVWYHPVGPDPPAIVALREVAAAQDVPIVAPRAGHQTHVGDLHLEVLGPPAGRPYRWSDVELNNSSIVVRVTWRDRRALLTGDVEHAAQADLLAHARARLHAELLTVPHHGAGTTDPAFLRAVGAQVALIGVGADNTYGHPHPRTVRTLERLGATVWRTDRDGSVQVEVPPPRTLRQPHPGRAPGHRALSPRHAPATSRRVRSSHGRRARGQGDRRPPRRSHAPR